MGAVAQIAWNDLRTALPAFLTIVLMPLTFSIANGVSIGILSYVALHTLTGRVKTLHPAIVVIASLLLARFAYLAMG